MGIGLRVRVEWDDTTVEDRVYVGRRPVRVGEGARATTVAPGWRVTATRRRGGYDLDLAGRGVLDRPGGPPLPVGGAGCRLRLHRAARLVSPTVTVELEVVDLARPGGDRALWAWAAAAALLALAGAGGVELTRRFGTGREPQWGRPSQLSMSEAERLRVRLGPDGRAATRPQTGGGAALHGRREVAPAPPVARVVPKAKGERPRVGSKPAPADSSRAAIDSFDRAAAQATWSRARVLDPSRPEAINNLASVAKRRGDIASALRLLDRGDVDCGGHYPYPATQRAGILALDGRREQALAQLELGLAAVDALLPIKEFEVLEDLRCDAAFAALRGDARFAALIARYLPRAAAHPEAGPRAPQPTPFTDEAPVDTSARGILEFVDETFDGTLEPPESRRPVVKLAPAPRTPR
jgi:hypothetical protein